MPLRAAVVVAPQLPTLSVSRRNLLKPTQLPPGRRLISTGRSLRRSPNLFVQFFKNNLCKFYANFTPIYANLMQIYARPIAICATNQ